MKRWRGAIIPDIPHGFALQADAVKTFGIGNLMKKPAFRHDIEELGPEFAHGLDSLQKAFRALSMGIARGKTP